MWIPVAPSLLGWFSSLLDGPRPVQWYRLEMRTQRRPVLLATTCQPASLPVSGLQILV